MPEKFLQDQRPDTSQDGRMSDFEFAVSIAIIVVCLIGGFVWSVIDDNEPDAPATCVKQAHCK